MTGADATPEECQTCPGYQSGLPCISEHLPEIHIEDVMEVYLTFSQAFGCSF